MWSEATFRLTVEKSSWKNVLKVVKKSKKSHG